MVTGIERLRQVKTPTTGGLTKLQATKQRRINLLEQKKAEVRERQARERVIAEQKKIAFELDRDFNLNNWATVSQAITELEKIKTTNKEIFKFMKVTPESLRVQQNKNIKILQDAKVRAQKKADEAKQDLRDSEGSRRDKFKARRSGYLEEAKELDKFIKEMQAGKVFDPQKVKNFADDVGDARRDERKVKLKNKRIKELQQKTIAKGQADLKTIIAKVENNKILSTSDFVRAQELGIKKTELQKFAADTKKYQANLKKVQEQTKQQKAQIEKSLGGFSKFVSPAQKEIIFKSQFVSTTPFLQLPNTIKIELNKIDKLDIKEFNKEKLKREVLGQTVSRLGEQLDLFGKTQAVKTLEANLKKNIQNDIKKQLGKINLSVDEKLRTGQSLTPKQQNQAIANIRVQGIKLGNEQKALAKKIWNSPANYAVNLNLRYRQGEKNPLFNDLRGVGVGFLKEIGDTINFVTGVKGITINSKGETYDGLIAKPARVIIDYGKSLYNAAGKQGVKAKLKADIKAGSKSYAKAIGKTIDVTEFAFKNPALSALIVGAAIDEGVVSSKKAFLKNPQENLGRAVVWMFPGTIVKGVTKVTKLKKLTQPVQRYAKNSFRATEDLVSGKIRIVGESKGVFSDGKNFITKYTVNFNKKTKLWVVRATTKSGKKTFTETFNLIEKRGFYVNPKTGEKVSKVRSTIDTQNIKIVEQKISPTKENVAIVNGEAFKTSQANIETVVTKIFDNVKKITKKTSEVSITVSDKSKKVVLGLSKQYLKDVKKTKTSITKGLTQAQVNQLESFLKSIQYDKVILGGLDKRTRLARALGLRKESNLLKPIEAIIDKNGKVKGVFRRSGQIAVTGSFEKGLKPKSFSDLIDKIPSFKLRGGLRKNKKGSITPSGLEKVSVITQKTKTALPSKKVFTLPEIKAKLPLNKKNIKLYGIGNNISRTTKLLDKLIKNSRKFDKVLENEQLIKLIGKEVAKIREKIRLRDKKVVKIQKRVTVKKVKKIAKVQPKKQLKKPVPKKKVTVKKPKVPKIVPKKKPRAPPIKKFKLPKIGDTLPRGKRISFNIRIAGKVFAIKKPINEALRRATTIVLRDKKLKKFDLIVAGTTKQKDTKRPKALNKFKGTKGEKVYTYVQK